VWIDVWIDFDGTANAKAPQLQKQRGREFAKYKRQRA
jgi:DNA topoisomerase IB